MSEAGESEGIASFRDLLSALGVADDEEVVDAIGTETDVYPELQREAEGIELRVGVHATLLTYPFALEEVWEVMEGLQRRLEDEDADDGTDEGAPTAPERDPIAFLPGVAEKLGWYVYALRDPLHDGVVFYVGKGKGDRAYQHAVHARVRAPGESRANLKLDTIRAIHSAGASVGIEIVRHAIPDESTAFEVEAGVIDALRIAGLSLSNQIRGHRTGGGWRPLAELVPELQAHRVEITDPVVLIRIRGFYRASMAPDDLYEATRKWWRYSGRRKPVWAFAVYDGIVRAVYKIEGDWTGPSPDELTQRTEGRKKFNGRRDPEMEDRYLWTHVGDYLAAGSQNPLRYVGC